MKRVHEARPYKVEFRRTSRPSSSHAEGRQLRVTREKAKSDRIEDGRNKKKIESARREKEEYVRNENERVRIVDDGQVSFHVIRKKKCGVKSHQSQSNKSRECRVKRIFSDMNCGKKN